MMETLPSSSRQMGENGEWNDLFHFWNFIDTPWEYCQKVCRYLSYAICQISIGGANIMALAYSLNGKEPHGAFCTLGWQLLMAEGTLVMVYTYANPLTHSHRRAAHMFLQILGLMFVMTGSVLIIYVFKQHGLSMQTHGKLGVAAFIITLINVLCGSVASLKYHGPKIVHGIAGIPMFILSTVAFITGACDPGFLAYCGLPIFVLLTLLTCYYALFVIVSACIKIFMRIQKLTEPPPVTSTDKEYNHL